MLKKKIKRAKGETDMVSDDSTDSEEYTQEDLDFIDDSELYEAFNTE